jgi:hypothetical protein
MIATPIIPGRAYRVTYHGKTITILASHACEAIRIAMGGASC